MVFELERRGHPGVSRSTVYWVLVRRHLVEPVSRRRRRDSYRRWERSAAMELWQMDVTASLFLRKTVAVTVGPGTIQVAVETSITVTAARTTSRDIRRHKASNYG